MIGGIIVTHGEFAPGIKNAVEMIAGKQDNLESISLREGDGLMDLIERIQKVKDNMEVDDVILFVDLFGATPCNASSVICSQCEAAVIAGVNLPLLLEFVLKREGKNREELITDIEQCAKEDFRVIRKNDLV